MHLVANSVWIINEVEGSIMLAPARLFNTISEVKNIDEICSCSYVPIHRFALSILQCVAVKWIIGLLRWVSWDFAIELNNTFAIPP